MPHPYARRLALVALAGGCSPTGDDSNGFGEGASEDTSAPASMDDDPGETRPTSAGDDGADTTSADEPKFDVGVSVDVPDHGCGEGNGGDSEDDFSMIWIANSGANGTQEGDSTVAKIDTRTAVEIARYRTGPGIGHFPSRTSVNLHGDVAISNRTGPDGGGVVKIATRASECVDADGDGVIETSTGPDDVLAWGEDECVLWYHPVPGTDYTTGPRPTAWEGGKFDDDPCTDDANPRLWIGWMEGNPASGQGDAHVRRVDGATGVSLDDVVIADFSGGTGAAYGIYGGAADKDGNFWGIGMWGRLVRIDAVTLTVTLWENPGGTPKSDAVDQMGSGWYGIALDADGNPWLASSHAIMGRVWTFDVATETFVDVGMGPGGWLRGIAVDREGRAWTTGTACQLVEADTVARAVVDPNIALPGCGSPVGVAVDVDGFVWVVDQTGNAAYKVDPDSKLVVATVGGLQMPYTYSDMTGAGLDLVVNGPRG